MLNLSQQEYVKKIDDMNRALCQAWDRDQKVKALKIAIQVHLIAFMFSICVNRCFILLFVPKLGWKATSGYFSNSVLS